MSSRLCIAITVPGYFVTVFRFVSPAGHHHVAGLARIGVGIAYADPPTEAAFTEHGWVVLNEHLNTVRLRDTGPPRCAACAGAHASAPARGREGTEAVHAG